MPKVAKDQPQTAHTVTSADASGTAKGEKLTAAQTRQNKPHDPGKYIGKNVYHNGRLFEKPLPPDDKKAFRDAVALLVGIQNRNGLEEKALMAAVGTSVHRAHTSKACETCSVKRANFGLPDDVKKKMRWCGSCAKVHKGAVNFGIRKCEGCGLKGTRFGLASERKKRWCIGCSKNQEEEVVDLDHRKCEDCAGPVPSYGLPDDVNKKSRWCSSCAKGHAGAVDVVGKKCEGCGLKQPSFGKPEGSGGDGKMRWCVACAKGHEGVANRARPSQQNSFAPGNSSVNTAQSPVITSNLLNFPIHQKGLNHMGEPRR